LRPIGQYKSGGIGPNKPSSVSEYNWSLGFGWKLLKGECGEMWGEEREKPSNGVSFVKVFRGEGVSVVGSKTGAEIFSFVRSGGCPGAVLDDPDRGVPIGFRGSVGLPAGALFLDLAASFGAIDLE
jgi:hypothetical protein